MPSKFNSVFGWFDYSDIYTEAVIKNDNCIFIEIGSFQGKSAIYMGELIKELGKNIKLVCVDLFPTKDELVTWGWIGAGQGAEAGLINDLPKSLLDTFVENTTNAGVDDVIIPVKSSSEKAVVLFADKSIPFAFVDAGHGKDTVLKDLRLYWPKITEGGVLAGHDWASNGVAEAVLEFFGELKLPIHVSVDSWIVYKPKEN